MTKPARKVRWRGVGEYRDEAEPHLEAAGDVAGVIRGRPRSLLMRCPDGCGETVVINLDPRAGKAWRVDIRNGTLSLYPSVWRNDGCKSHFIIWRDHIIWCGIFERDNEEPVFDEALIAIVQAELRPDAYREPHEIADHIGEIWWDVSRALRHLVRQGIAEEGKGFDRHRFRLASRPQILRRN